MVSHPEHGSMAHNRVVRYRVTCNLSLLLNYHHPQLADAIAMRTFKAVVLYVLSRAVRNRGESATCCASYRRAEESDARLLLVL